MAERYYELASSRWEDEKQSGWGLEKEGKAKSRRESRDELALSRREDKKQSGRGLEKEGTAKSWRESGVTMTDQGRHHLNMRCPQESDGPCAEYSPGGPL